MEKRSRPTSSSPPNPPSPKYTRFSSITGSLLPLVVSPVLSLDDLSSKVQEIERYAADVFAHPGSPSTHSPMKAFLGSTDCPESLTRGQAILLVYAQVLFQTRSLDLRWVQAPSTVTDCDMATPPSGSKNLFRHLLEFGTDPLPLPQDQQPFAMEREARVAMGKWCMAAILAMGENAFSDPQFNSMTAPKVSVSVLTEQMKLLKDYCGTSSPQIAECYSMFASREQRDLGKKFMALFHNPAVSVSVPLPQANWKLYHGASKKMTFENKCRDENDMEPVTMSLRALLKQRHKYINKKFSLWRPISTSWNINASLSFTRGVGVDSKDGGVLIILTAAEGVSVPAIYTTAMHKLNIHPSMFSQEHEVLLPPFLDMKLVSARELIGGIARTDLLRNGSLAETSPDRTRWVVHFEIVEVRIPRVIM